MTLARVVRAALGCAFTLALTSASAAAQTALTHTEDATPIPRGSLRFTIANGWTRYESRLGQGGIINALGEELSSDSLGPRQLPNLAPVEGALQTLAGNPAVRLTFGRLDVRSDARIVTTPIAIELGVTHRLSIGVMVPVVQTRGTAQVRVNAHAAGDTVRTSNMGFINEANRTQAATTNAGVVSALNTAATSVATLLAQCQQNPSATSCAPISGRETQAAAAVQQARAFAAAVGVAYGTTDSTALVAPLAGSLLARDIDLRRAALAAQLASFGATGNIGTLFNAPSEFSYIDLQGRFPVAGLLQSSLGGGLDSIHTTSRIGLGDIEVRARLLLLDHVQRDSLPARGLQYRLALGGLVRFATSRVDSSRNLIDIPTGEGAGAGANAVLEFVSGRLGGTVAARYEKSFARDVVAALVGFPVAGFPNPVFGQVSQTNGDLVGLDVMPRAFLGEWFAFEGEYGLQHVGATTYSNVPPNACSACIPLANSVLPVASTVQRLGIGVRYSTIDSYLRRRARYPVEVSYRHLETLSGAVGTPKAFSDQILMRIYYNPSRQP